MKRNITDKQEVINYLKFAIKEVSKTENKVRFIKDSTISGLVGGIKAKTLWCDLYISNISNTLCFCGTSVCLPDQKDLWNN